MLFVWGRYFEDLGVEARAQTRAIPVPINGQKLLTIKINYEQLIKILLCSPLLLIFSFVVLWQKM